MLQPPTSNHQPPTSNQQPTVTSLRSVPRSAWKALIAAQLGWMLDSFDVMLFSLLGKNIMEDFGFGKPEAGLLGAITLLAAAGGVIAYRAIYLEPAVAVVITNTEVREVPNTTRIIGGAAMLVAGATVAFLAARRKG